MMIFHISSDQISSRRVVLSKESVKQEKAEEEARKILQYQVGPILKMLRHTHAHIQ
jgi:hypothetical protein